MLAAGAISLGALAVVIASLGYLHLTSTGLSPVRAAVSQYGISPHRAGYRVATIAFAVAALALAAGIGESTLDGSTVVIAVLVVFAIARAAISWFPMDAPGAERTPTGQVHGFLAFVAFVSVATAALDLGRTIARQTATPGHGPIWGSLASVSTDLGWAMLATLLAMGFSRSNPALRARFGAIERGFYALAISWVALFASACVANVR